MRHYRIRLNKRRKATGEHTFEVENFIGVKAYIEWNSKTGYFEYIGSKPTVHYGIYQLINT
jgi:hypothetical protein